MLRRPTRRGNRRCPASTASDVRRRTAEPSMSDEAPPDASQESFMSHLVELRLRLVRTMIATDVTGTFLVPLKVTLMAGIVLALPYVLWQAWAFVAPGLYQHEKRLALPVIVSSFLFFLIGMSFAYFVVFPIAFGFFAGYTPAGVQMMTDIDKYLSFVLTMFIAFGVTFEVPVIVIVLVRLRMVSLEKLRSIRPYVIVGAFVIGAIFTPPDVISQMLLAVPLWLLYELGIAVARFVQPPAEEEQTAAAQ